MSEPTAMAESIEEVAVGIWRWYLWDDRIDFESDAHAVAGDGGIVLIDPIPLREDALGKLGPIAAICLTAACHQRSAWRYRRIFGVKVHAPEGCRAMDEEPDERYADAALLPGGLRAIHTPGPEPAHFALLREAAPATPFCPDLVMHTGRDDLAFVPPEYHDDPAATRTSVRRLLAMPFQVLCFDHGPPLTADPDAALRELLGER